MAFRGDDDLPEEETDLRNPDVVTKYKAAADICNRVLGKLLTEIVPGAKVVDLCRSGDSQIEEALKPLYVKAKLPKGVAFPTCISINNCLGHFSPLSNDATVVREGDLVKIDLGVHVDGYIAVVGHTAVATASKEPIRGRAADVIAAAYHAADAAVHMLRSGQTNKPIPEIVTKAAASYRCTPIEGSASYQMRRFLIDGEKVILNKASPEARVEEVTFEDFEVYALDVVVSTGEGKGREADARTTVFKRALDQAYLLKLKAARTLFNDINNRFPTVPFTLRAFEDEARARLGITELVNHNLVTPYPVLFEKQGELVAQFKFTVLLMANGTSRITGLPMPAVQSEHSITDADVKAALQTSLKKPTGKKPAAAAGAKKPAKKGKKRVGLKAAAKPAAASAEEDEEIEEVDDDEDTPAGSSS
eukprot:TRINITY_DN521_c0_g3_i1.p1 TRINITY_DN521_c0_g3~~TRINITY_DN521_c0_g3_i1.p1  ORF type:complete len:419 (+),score=109.63 TRINITY_DN521_c0_g3_i1:97-1353(+)